MLRNYLAAAIRNLARNKVYAGLNIVGLAVGFAAALFITLFVRDELSYDKWLPDAANIAVLTEKLQIPNQSLMTDMIIPPDLKKPLQLDYPGIDKIARLEASRLPTALKRGDIETTGDLVYWADPEFFSVIKLPVLAGDIDEALTEPNSVVITRRMAQKYFGKDTPLGETLEFDRTRLMKVTAVLKDLPSNTQFNTEIIASALTANASQIANVDANPPEGWGLGAYTYVTFKPGTTADDVQKTLPEFIAKHKASSIRFTGKEPLHFMPMTAVHLAENVRGGIFFTLNSGGDIDSIKGIAVIGALVLFIAAINFVNLTTARTTRRAVEVGVRKTAGAKASDLIVQFIGESLLYVTFGMIVAVALVGIGLPAFNAYLRRTIMFDLWADPMLLAGIIGTVLVVGIAAGAYPAFVLSRFNPKVVMKSGTIQAGASGRLRSALVVLQFAILIGLILSTFMIYQQTNYALNRGTNMSIARVHVIQNGCAPAMQNGVRAIVGVEAVACSSGSVLNKTKGGGSIRTPAGTDITVDASRIDFGLFELYGLKPVAGRYFSPEFAGDRQPDPLPPPVAGRLAPAQEPPSRLPIVVNESLARKISPRDPAAAVGMTVAPNMGSNNAGEFPIIGVVPDFALDATHQLVPPTMHFLMPNAEIAQGGFLSVKLRSGADEKAVLDEIDKLWSARSDGRPIVRYSQELYLREVNADIIRQAEIIAIFAVIAVLVAALGLFGLSAFTAERRTKEIGVRKAMGASRTDILRLLLWQFTKPALWATVIAWPIGYVVMQRWLEGFAYHIDLAPWMFLAASALALLIAVLTVVGHTLLVARAQPVAALRYE